MNEYEQAVWDGLFNAYTYGIPSPLDSLVPALLKYSRYLDENDIRTEFTIRVLGFDITRKAL